MGNKPRILVTNDDGIESRGLLALKQSPDPLGDVCVLAPETNQSAVGHTKTFMRPLPAFAISQECYEHPDFSLAAQIAYVAAVNILENGLAPGELININVPAITLAESGR